MKATRFSSSYFLAVIIFGLFVGEQRFFCRCHSSASFRAVSQVWLCTITCIPSTFASACAEVSTFAGCCRTCAYLLRWQLPSDALHLGKSKDNVRGSMRRTNLHKSLLECVSILPQRSERSDHEPSPTLLGGRLYFVWSDNYLTKCKCPQIDRRDVILQHLSPHPARWSEVHTKRETRKNCVWQKCVIWSWNGQILIYIFICTTENNES